MRISGETPAIRQPACLDASAPVRQPVAGTSQCARAASAASAPKSSPWCAPLRSPLHVSPARRRAAAQACGWPSARAAALGRTAPALEQMGGRAARYARRVRGMSQRRGGARTHIKPGCDSLQARDRETRGRAIAPQAAGRQAAIKIVLRRSNRNAVQLTRLMPLARARHD